MGEILSRCGPPLDVSSAGLQLGSTERRITLCTTNGAVSPAVPRLTLGEIGFVPSYGARCALGTG